MIFMKNVRVLTLVLLVSACNIDKKEMARWEASAPAADRYTSIDKSGETVLPNGRIITPVGKQITVAPHPFGLAISPDGKTIVTANSGVSPFSISIIHDFNSPGAIINQIPDNKKEEVEDEEDDDDDDELKATFMGLAVSPDNQKIYVSAGQENEIYVFNLQTGKRVAEIKCNVSFDGTDFSDGYIGELALSQDGSKLYAVDQIGFRVVVVDTRTNRVIQNIRTGRYPFGIALSPDEKTLYVANIGMFEYNYIKSLDKKRLKETALRFPAFAYGSKEMKEGIKNDTLEVSGLGEMNSDDSFSVWTVDVGTSQPQVVAKIKTGTLVNESTDGVPAVGGASPNAIVASGDFVYVSNANNDNVSVIDAKTKKVIDAIDLKLDERLGNLKGVMPFGLCLSPDGKKLFVAESGINAVAVIDVATRKILGHLPAGWFPSKVKVTPDGKQLIVTNAKGFGSGPNGGKNFHPPVDHPYASYIGALMLGTVSVMDIPSEEELKSLTAKVVANNFSFKKVESKEWLPPIKHIVFISKENRTYDEVFGQLKKSDGDSTLARFGAHVSFTNKSGTQKVTNATVMPNHLVLAQQFSVSDNFYVDSDVSADGHVWLTNTYPTQWMETHHPASYGGKRNLKVESKAPGKFGMTGAAGAIFPESYNQHGSMWDHLFRNGKEFYNFGFGVEFDAGNFADSTMKYGGVRYLVNYPLPGPLYDRTSRMFPTFNMTIPDQFRADVFIKEVKEKYLDAKKELPSMLTLQLLNDHGAGERVHAGFPFNESYMADNDLALGRIIKFLSHTPQWKNMLIVVTEDDAQGGRDHVDAHRSLLMLISPYAKRDFVSHAHASFGSIFKTFWQLLDIPYLNQYDFGASNLSDLFTQQPDFTPYQAIPSDLRIFDPSKAMTPLHEKFDWEAFRHSAVMDDPEEMKKQMKDDGRRKVNH
jgi:YVTN family beta-propeller protein